LDKLVFHKNRTYFSFKDFPRRKVNGFVDKFSF
jgi:hypothetical protein